MAFNSSDDTYTSGRLNEFLDAEMFGTPDPPFYEDSLDGFRVDDSNASKPANEGAAEPANEEAAELPASVADQTTTIENATQSSETPEWNAATFMDRLKEFCQEPLLPQQQRVSQQPRLPQQPRFPQQEYTQHNGARRTDTNSLFVAPHSTTNDFDFDLFNDNHGATVQPGSYSPPLFPVDSTASVSGTQRNGNATPNIFDSFLPANNGATVQPARAFSRYLPTDTTATVTESQFTDDTPDNFGLLFPNHNNNINNNNNNGVDILNTLPAHVDYINTNAFTRNEDFVNEVWLQQQLQQTLTQSPASPESPTPDHPTAGQNIPTARIGRQPRATKEQIDALVGISLPEDAQDFFLDGLRTMPAHMRHGTGSKYPSYPSANTTLAHETFSVVEAAKSRLERTGPGILYHVLRIANDDFGYADNNMIAMMGRFILRGLQQPPSAAPPQIADADKAKFEKVQQDAFNRVEKILSCDEVFSDVAARCTLLVDAAYRLHTRGIPVADLDAEKLAKGKLYASGYLVDAESPFMQRMHKILYVVSTNKLVALDVLNGSNIDALVRSPRETVHRKVLNFRGNDTKAKLAELGLEAATRQAIGNVFGPDGQVSMAPPQPRGRKRKATTATANTLTTVNSAPTTPAAATPAPTTPAAATPAPTYPAAATPMHATPAPVTPTPIIPTAIVQTANIPTPAMQVPATPASIAPAPSTTTSVNSTPLGPSSIVEPARKRARQGQGPAINSGDHGFTNNPFFPNDSNNSGL